MDVELRPVTDLDVEVFYEQHLDPEARRVAAVAMNVCGPPDMAL